MSSEWIGSSQQSLAASQRLGIWRPRGGLSFDLMSLNPGHIQEMLRVFALTAQKGKWLILRTNCEPDPVLRPHFSDDSTDLEGKSHLPWVTQLGDTGARFCTQLFLTLCLPKTRGGKRLQFAPLQSDHLTLWILFQNYISWLVVQALKWRWGSLLLPL